MSALMQGYEARREGRLEDARRIFADAARLAENKSGLVAALTGLGQIERDLGNFDAALRHYEEAVLVCRSLSEPLRLAHTIRHVADILRESGQLQAAELPYRESLEIYRAQAGTAPLDLANAIRGFALLKALNEESGSALELWLEARDLYAAVGVQAGIDEGDRQVERLSRVASPDHRQ